MYKVLVVVFDSEQQADEGVKALEALHTEGSVTLHRQAVIAKDADGRTTVKESSDQGSDVAAVGFVTTKAGVSGEAAGLVIAADYLERVIGQLEPGKVVVIAEVQEELPTSVDSRMAAAGGTVSRQDAGEILHARVERDLSAVKTQLDTVKGDVERESKDAGAMLKAGMDADKAELQKRQERVRARLEATRLEAEAKIAALKEQMASAQAERKQQLEQRLAEVEEGFKARTARLRRALEHTEEAPGGTEPAEESAAPGDYHLIERVYEGMVVVDADGKEIGKVELVRMGDPEAGSLEGQWRDEVRILDAVFVEGEPDLPRELRHDLLRMGFLRVERRRPLGIGEKKHYIRADRIAYIVGERVVLTVTEAKLPDDRDQPGPIIS